MTRCTHGQPMYSGGRGSIRARVSGQRCGEGVAAGSMFCDLHRLEHLATLKPVDPHQQIIRDLRWRFGVGSGVVV